MLQQRILSRPSLSLQRALLHLWTAAASQFELPSPDAVSTQTILTGILPTAFSTPAGRAWRCLSAALHMEIALTWHEYRLPRDANVSMQRARDDLAVQVEVVGALGLRTEAQQVARAQLVLQLTRGPEGGHDWDADEAMTVRPRVADDDVTWAGWKDDSEVYDVPKLVSDGRACPLPLQLSTENQ